MLGQYILDIDGIKKFFSSRDNTIQCKDKFESDIIISICKSLGYDIYKDHNPNGNYHAIYSTNGTYIMFSANGGQRWKNGIPFISWMDKYAIQINLNLDLTEFV